MDFVETAYTGYAMLLASKYGLGLCEFEEISSQSKSSGRAGLPGKILLALNTGAGRPAAKFRVFDISLTVETEGWRWREFSVSTTRGQRGERETNDLGDSSTKDALIIRSAVRALWLCGGGGQSAGQETCAIDEFSRCGSHRMGSAPTYKPARLFGFRERGPSFRPSPD